MEEADSDGSGEIDFVEFAALMGRRLKEQDKQEELEEVFKVFDKNVDGIIDYKDLKEVFVELGTDITIENCKRLIQMYDTDGDGKLGFNEFVAFMLPPDNNHK